MTTTSSLLARFADERFMNLETFRKDGRGVQTPIWFIEEAGSLYFSAPAHTGKVKRLRREARANIVPCDGKGTPRGPWIAARVTPIDGAAAEHADRLLSRKYGLQKWLLEAFGRLRRWSYVVYRVEGVQPQEEHHAD